jgi:hypothetical protein
MTIDFSNIGSWIWTIIGLIILFIIFRFFFHIVVRIFHFIMSFFWHGCITVIVLLVIYYILRALGVF